MGQTAEKESQLMYSICIFSKKLLNKIVIKNYVLLQNTIKMTLIIFSESKKAYFMVIKYYTEK